MDIEVKIYSYHDMELVSLFKSGRMEFPKTTKRALTAFAHGQAYKIRMRPIDRGRLEMFEKMKNCRYYRYFVTLDEKKDADVIAMLEDIEKGCRNNFIKTVLRQYIGCEIPYGYSISGKGKGQFRKMSAAFCAQLDEKEGLRPRKVPERKPKDGAEKGRAPGTVSAGKDGSNASPGVTLPEKAAIPKADAGKNTSRKENSGSSGSTGSRGSAASGMGAGPKERRPDGTSAHAGAAAGRDGAQSGTRKPETTGGRQEKNVWQTGQKNAAQAAYDGHDKGGMPAAGKQGTQAGTSGTSAAAAAAARTEGMGRHDDSPARNAAGSNADNAKAPEADAAPKTVHIQEDDGDSFDIDDFLAGAMEEY